MSRREFILSSRYRLGLYVFPKNGVCPVPNCSKESDRYGDHSLLCASSSERISRHNRLRDALFGIAVEAGLSPRKEESDLFSGSKRKPGDIFIPGWKNGKDCALDVTVVCPIQDSMVDKAAAKALYAADEAFKRKNTKNVDDCAKINVEFIALAVETFGGWNTISSFHIRLLARQLARQNDENESVITAQIMQKLSIVLQRGNSSLIASRIPTTCPTDISGQV